jgi:hypothetical protein
MRSQRFVTTMLVCIAALVPAVVFASDNPFTTGTVVFSPSVSFNRSSITPPGSETASSATRLNLGAAVGRCMSDRVELTGGLLFQHQAAAGTGYNGIGASAGATFNFTPQENVIPFLSANLGAISYSSHGSSDQAWLLPMLRLGVRTMMGDNRALDVSIGYQHEVNHESVFEKSADVFEVGIGMSVLRSRVDD